MFYGLYYAYITFGTNLLTQSPVPVPVFPLFQCFEEKEYQMESKWNETNWRSYFWKESYRKNLECTSGKKRESHEAGGRALPPGAPYTLMGPSWLPSRTSFTYIFAYPLKTSGNRIDLEFPRRKPL